MTNRIIEESLNRGFGSMNKNDYEVLIFHILRGLESDDEKSIKDLSSYAISKKLRIPESKVKRLLYESDLRYPEDNENLKNELMQVFKKVHFQKDGKTLKFVVKKKVLRQYLADELAKDERFFDMSFNTEIVVISTTDLYYIYEELYADEAKEMLADVKRRASEEKNLPTTWQDVLKAIAKHGAKKYLGDSFDTIADFSMESIEKHLQSKIQSD